MRTIQILLLGIFILITTGCQHKLFVAPLSTHTKTHANNLIETLKNGGNVVYFRHAQTEKDYADQVVADVHNCSTQRVLSEIGWNQAKSIGKAFKALEIPVQKVWTSQYCRAWKTADLAFGQHIKDASLNFLPKEDYTESDRQIMKKNVWPFLVTVPETGQNIIIVGHDDLFESATGIYPEPQGIGYILKPSGDDFEILGSINPGEWDKF